MRALTCRSHTEWQKFDQHFRRYWFPEELEIKEYDLLAQIDPRLRSQNRVSGISGTSSREPDSIYGDAGLRGTGAGNQRNITRTDYRFLNDRQAMRQVEKLAERLAQQLKRKLSRRYTYKTRGTRLNLRKTIRNNLSSAGFPARRIFSNRRKDPIQLVIFHDISHSMAWNNPLLFRFARGLVRTFKGSHAFAFHTRLFPVTHYYREQSLDVMRQKLEANNRLWMGGTRIGESLATFNRDYARGIVSPKTIVIIISDGFDTDDAECLDKELNQLAVSCKKIIWLNPMLGRPGVTTTADDLQKLFPQVDQFIAANSLYGLQQSVDTMIATVR